MKGGGEGEMDPKQQRQLCEGEAAGIKTGYLKRDPLV